MTYKIIYNFNCKDYELQVPKKSFIRIRNIMLINKRRTTKRDKMIIKRGRRYIVSEYYFEAYNGDRLLYAKEERYVQYPWYVVTDYSDTDLYEECYVTKELAIQEAEKDFARLTPEEIERRKEFRVVESWTKDTTSEIFAAGKVIKDFLKETKNK